MKRAESITVDELIEELTRLRENGLGDAAVLAFCSYGDRGNTMQGICLQEIRPVTIRESAYSQSGLALDEEAPEGQTDPERPVIGCLPG